MKKLLLVSALAAAVLPVSAIAPGPQQGPARASSSDIDFTVYYPAPAGVFYLGMPLDNDHYDVPEYAVAPNGVDITFHTDINTARNDYEWDFLNQSAENKDLVINFAEVKAVGETPTLFMNGYDGRGTYNMARGGMIFGQGYYENFYASNLNIACINSAFFNVAGLALNYAEAGKNFADEYPLSISDVKIKGWGELYRYGGKPYTMDAVRMALIFTGAEIDVNQVEADIYPYTPDAPIDPSAKIATYVNKAIQKFDTYQGSYWYTVECGPAEGESAPVIKGDVIVVYRLAEGVETIVSPDMAGIPGLPECEPTTSFVIADYTRSGNTVANGCLPYVGEYESRDGMQYSKHWNASAKINYNVPTQGITDAVATPEAESDPAVYNLQGIKVADSLQDAALPAGLYISGGKKHIVR